MSLFLDDHSRVVLKSVRDTAGSDYINANYVDVSYFSLKLNTFAFDYAVSQLISWDVCVCVYWGGGGGWGKGRGENRCTLTPEPAQFIPGVSVLCGHPNQG